MTRRPGTGTGCILSLGLAMLAPSATPAQVGFRAWVGLYEDAQPGWLENENRLDELCRDAASLDACRREHLAPRVSIHALHAGPDSSSASIGELIVVATPGRGLSAHFRAAGSERTVAFTPDLYLQDWGYGPYFHQTVSDREGDWFALPREPWFETTWLRRPDDSAAAIYLQAGDLIEMRGSGWFIISADADALVLRPEQPADLWCEEGDPPPITPFEPIRFTRPELLDLDGHLVLRLKYLKGC